MEQQTIIKQAAILVTPAAEQHFRDLLQKEEVEEMNLRIFVSHPGTPHAEVSITFCPEGEALESDFSLNFKDFTLFVDKASEAALSTATIDFTSDELGGGQLSIKAPHLKGLAPKEDSAFQERVQYVIDSEINPLLAMHRGEIKLVDILSEKIIVLEFGGGCHGCGMASATLKQGVEKTLKEKFPQIVEVRDVTDHTTGQNPYC